MKIIDTTKETIDLSKLILRKNLDVVEQVGDILRRVKDEGDSALVEYTSRFDGVDAEVPCIMFRDELENYCKTIAVDALTKDQVRAIEKSVENISWFASKTIPQSWRDTGTDGQSVGEVFIPFDRVACYVPQGSFPLVSTVIHTASIANTCGVKEIIMVTSPSLNDLNPAVALAALLSGVTEIVFVGGAQGIASVAYGTQSIKCVDFICGPGNSFVAEAKRQLFGVVGIDMVAGPSEVFVVGDSSADAYGIACDLVAQSEHGSGYEAAVLLSDSKELIDDVANQLEKLKDQLNDNSGFKQVYENSLFLVLTDSIDRAIGIVNECAPEHVEVITTNAKEDVQKITCAGAVFIGKYSPEPIGDFVAGPSHVLPTNSTARFQNGLSSSSFFRRTSIIELGCDSYSKLARFANEFASMEGLIGHGLSSLSRQKLEDNY